MPWFLSRPSRWVALLFLLFLIGCRGGSAPLSPVRGKVSYQGNLLPSGFVVFVPDSSKGTKGELAIGEIQTDGTFALKTGDKTGVAPGWHRVTVAAVRPATSPSPGQRFPVPVSLLPDRYCDPQLSGLLCEVKADKANTIDFHLE